jgi:hypothetical protein
VIQSKLLLFPVFGIKIRFDLENSSFPNNNPPDQNMISPGKEKFYEKENFKRMKTGMALFINGERMQRNGFTE